MDYEFLRMTTGEVIAKFSMGHEAIGYWLNEEIEANCSLIKKIEHETIELKNSEQQWVLEGHEYTLSVSNNEVMVQANQLIFNTEGIEEGMSYYDEESLAFCGLEDFLIMLKAYYKFISNNY